ncbi:serine protease 7-like [Anopheles ziemanni]|uniref:serine protease 7-like n=1 Tax=Anopheles coustani TaxID=139045 RepID=UPI002658478A|nr:serine protease 7-like [Anopheles coustani]XP_058169087.1 serine protease 7-like [Anopheles ziemanni]
MEDSNRNQPPASGISESTTSNRPQCGIQPAARESIIEGTSRNIGFHPWSVLLHNGNRRTLISAEYVLTSAGCVDEVDKRVNLTAKLGEYDLESDVDCIFAGPNDDMICAKPSYDVKVAEVLVHEAAGNRLHDIALLQLSEPVKIDEWVSPICLPESAAIDHSATYHSASWNQNTCEDGSRRYKFLSNYSLTNVTANNFIYVSSAGQPFVDVGGALTVTKTIDSNDGSRSVNELVGVLSSTATCANYDGVLVYTKVGQYLEWIQDKLVNEESATTRV